MQTQLPIRTVHLLPVLDAHLFELLGGLAEKEWYAQSIAKKWVVKDIAAHLLDGNIRTLSFSRDRLTLKPDHSITGYRELVDYLNGLNADWVKASRRISPALLLDLLQYTGKKFCEHLASLDPFEESIFPVDWAGESKSKNWFHIAREYTEKFIHQLQIRDAVNKPGLITPELFFPFLDTLFRGLPHTYRNTKAQEGTAIRITVNTTAGGQWYLLRKKETWELSRDYQGNLTATVSLEPDIAWKLFSKSLSPEMALPKTSITGDAALGRQALEMVSVMA